MAADKPISKIPILIEQKGTYYKYAKVDSLDAGKGVLIYDYRGGRKISRHADGTRWDRIAGAGEHVPPATSVKYSDIRHEVIWEVPLPVDTLEHLDPLAGTVPSNAFVFSSTVLSSYGTFAAELVADEDVDAVAKAWARNPYYVSAQSCRTNVNGKTLILTALNRGTT